MKTLIVSDIHANLPAFNAVINKDGNYDMLLFLGDVVDYGPNPRECLDFMKDNADYGVRGNHDNALGYNVDCNCMGTFREYSTTTREWHKSLLNEDDIRFLRNLPVINKFEIEGKSFHTAHASPQGNMFKYIDKENMTKELNGIYSDFILVGHTHVQYMKETDNGLIVNPGSVGLARDGGQACYAVYEDGTIILKRIDYDVDKTVADLMKSPLPQNVKSGLKKVLLNE